MAGSWAYSPFLILWLAHVSAGTLNANPDGSRSAKALPDPQYQAGLFQETKKINMKKFKHPLLLKFAH